MLCKTLFVVASLLVLVVPDASLAGGTKVLESVPDLERAMYLTVDGYPCVRLLNLSGEIGCSNPGGEKIIAPILKYDNSRGQLAQLSAVVVPIDQMENFFLRVSRDLQFGQKVAGVLVASDAYRNESTGFSPAKKFPQAEFAPYQNMNYEWNPAGSGIMWNHYNFPVFLLSDESTTTVQELASRNAKVNSEYPVNVAEFDLIMQTTKVGTHDSQACLKERSCLPLGGYSVWSSLPPISVSPVRAPKRIILTVASLDSASFFRDKSLGADSPLSGLIALLAAVDALSHATDIDEFQKQLVFAVFTGEAWGYLGSRRFLHELDIGTDAVSGLNSTLIEQVIEIGSVGKALVNNETIFYAHSAEESLSVEMLEALEMASDSLGTDKVKIKKAATSNPGVPPSSMMSFLQKNSSISGIVLEEFDSSFTNKFYHSYLDTPLNINTSSISAAAILVARALSILASGDMKHPNLIALNSIKVNASLVEELVGCLLTCEPGLSCGFVTSFISASSVCPSHYVGVFVDAPSDVQPQYIDDTSRFVWNFLADRTSTKMSNTSSCKGTCPDENEVCITSETESGGRCVTSTTRYIPAYSTRLKFEDGFWQLMPANASDSMGQVDPVWTESFWNTIGLRVYTVQSSRYDRFILLSGIAVTIASYLAVLVTRSYLAKALKRD